MIINRDAIPDRNTIWSVLNGHRSRENLGLQLSSREFITKMAAVNFFSAMVQCCCFAS